MCDCTTHYWLARPVQPHPGDQVITGGSTDRVDAYGAALAAALAVHDRRTELRDHTDVLIEIVLDEQVIGWLPHHGAQDRTHDRADLLDQLTHLHGDLRGHGLDTAIPKLPADTIRVDLDARDPAHDRPFHELVPSTHGPRP